MNLEKPTSPLPVTGRRDRQKADRQRRILSAADELFGRRGYGRTTMEDVARRARLAVGTIYNYFPSKPELVLALLRRETGETLARGVAVVKEPPADPVAAVTALFDVYMDLVARHDRGQLRELFAAALAQPEAIARPAFEMDLRLIGQLAGLLEHLKGEGRLDPGLESGRVATTLYAVYLTWLVVMATLDGFSIQRFRDEVRGGIELIMRGLLLEHRRRGPTRHKLMRTANHL